MGKIYINVLWTNMKQCCVCEAMFVALNGSNARWSKVKPCAWCIMHLVVNWIRN